MSSLEERRAERRRRRQMEEESLRNGTMTPEELHADLDARLARRRKEREDRMRAIAASVSAVNGEDDLERRRRERREARLKASGGGDTEDYSSRRSRRRATEEEDASEETSSYRSRRHRNYEDDEDEDTTSSYRSRRRRGYEEEEETPTYNDTSATDDTDTAAAEAAAAEAAREEQRRRQREEEEEEAHRQQEREEAEERRRQEAEARRREEEEDRRREEERLRRKQEADAEFEALEAKYAETGLEDEQRLKYHEVSEDNTNSGSVSLQSDSDVDKTDKSDGVIDRINETGDNLKEGKHLQRVRSNSFDKNNRRITAKINKFQQWDKENVKEKGKDRNSNYLPDKKEGLKNKVNKFEKEIQDQESPARKGNSQRSPRLKEVNFIVKKVNEKLQQFEAKAQSENETDAQLVRSHSHSSQSSVKVVPSSKLKDIQKHFEKGSQNENAGHRSALLSRWSMSETNIYSPDSKSDTKKHVLDRWKPLTDTQKSSPSPRDNLSKRLSGNTEFITSRFVVKANENAGNTCTQTSPLPSPLERSHSFQSGISVRRSSSQSSETLSECSDRSLHHDTGRKVTDRWQHHIQETSISPKSSKINSTLDSRGLSCDNSYVHNGGSSSDEEEARLEQERQEAERERKEEEERMAAEQERKKKKGKKKGLGGLSPEKKKKLKEFSFVDYDTEEEEEKWQVVSERLTPLPDDFDSLSTADLKKLCKQLHDKLAQFESDVYDWEFKVEKQELEVNELTLKVNDSKGKFCKPVLRKTNKTDAKFAKMKKKNKKEDFRENLKSTGQSKFEVDEEQVKSPDYRDTLKKPAELEDN